jgi:hypothetical protein
MVEGAEDLLAGGAQHQATRVPWQGGFTRRRQAAARRGGGAGSWASAPASPLRVGGDAAAPASPWRVGGGVAPPASPRRAEAARPLREARGVRTRRGPFGQHAACGRGATAPGSTRRGRGSVAALASLRHGRGSATPQAAARWRRRGGLPSQQWRFQGHKPWASLPKSWFV